MPLAGVETDMVRVVAAADRQSEPVEGDSIELAGVAVRLLDLADQGAVHQARPSSPRRGSGVRRPVLHHRPGEAAVAQGYSQSPRRVSPQIPHRARPAAPEPVAFFPNATPGSTRRDEDSCSCQTRPSVHIWQSNGPIRASKRPFADLELV